MAVHVLSVQEEGLVMAVHVLSVQEEGLVMW